MWAGSSALLRLFFPSFIRFLLLLVQLQNTVDIGLGRQQLFHFLTGFSVVGVGRFLLRQQLGVLGIQRLDGGQLLEAKPIKIVLCSLVDRDLTFMRCKKFLGVPSPTRTTRRSPWISMYCPCRKRRERTL